MNVNSTSQDSFTKNHQLYDQVRPGFLSEAVDSMCEDLALDDSANVVELAAGTGKFTKSIADKPWKITAVEPSTGMVASFKKNFPQIPIIEASSYKLPFGDNSVDCLIIAQAFHWFADQDSLKEIARVLKKKTGKLALIWNYDFDDGTEPSWQSRTTHLAWSFDGSVPQYRKQNWPLEFEEQPWFEVPYKESHFVWYSRLKPQDLWPYWASRSYITSLDEKTKNDVKTRMETILREEVTEQDYDIDGYLHAKRGVHVVVAKRTGF